MSSYLPLDTRTLLTPSSFEPTKTLGSAELMKAHIRS